MTQLLIATAIGAALVSGIFYAFSTFVTRCEAAIEAHDRRSVEEDERLLSSG